jgi:hypothetical protein
MHQQSLQWRLSPQDELGRLDADLAVRIQNRGAPDLCALVVVASSCPDRSLLLAERDKPLFLLWREPCNRARHG